MMQARIETKGMTFDSTEVKPKRALLSGREDLEHLSWQYNIPEEDILLIALNASGIKYGDIVNDRGRFIATFPNNHRYLLARYSNR